MRSYQTMLRSIPILRTRVFKPANSSFNSQWGGTRNTDGKRKYIKRNGCKMTQTEVDVIRSLSNTRKDKRILRAIIHKQDIAIKVYKQTVIRLQCNQ